MNTVYFCIIDNTKNSVISYGSCTDQELPLQIGRLDPERYSVQQIDEQGMAELLEAGDRALAENSRLR